MRRGLEHLQGWTGVAWEPAWSCDHCGVQVSATTAELVREAKYEHRQQCPPREQVVSERR